MGKTVKTCPIQKKCSGCQLRNLEYRDQLALKQRICVKELGRFCRVEDIIGMDDPARYRNKLQAVFGFERGKIVSGVWQSKDRRIAVTDDCLIEDELSCRIVVTIRELMRSFKLTAYDMRTGRGFLRSVQVRRAFTTNEILVSLVGATPVFPSKRGFVNALVTKHPEITTVVFSVSTDMKALMPGSNESVMYGDGYITDILCGLRFRITAASFYQINPVQTELMYSTAVELAGLTGSETVVDAYCGVGTIGLIAAGHARHVIGIENNFSAVKNAISNARLNGIENARFYRGDAGTFMEDAAASGERCDVLFTDPPRAGCSEKFLASVCMLSPRRIVYVSCNPETLARDLEYLTSRGYRAETARPFDMFPYTRHVETIVLMSRADR